MTISSTYWEVHGTRYAIPLERFEESIERRIGRHRRLYKNGARLDGMARNEKVWKAIVPFNDTCEDTHVLAEGKLLYTDVMPAFIASMDQNETGNLMTTRGIVRAQLEMMRIIETSDERLSMGSDLFSGPQNEQTFSLGFAIVECTWVEDTEDDFSTKPSQTSSKSKAKANAEALGKLVELEGMGGGDLIGFLSDWASMATLPTPENLIAETVSAYAAGIIHQLDRLEQNYAEKYSTTPREAAAKPWNTESRAAADQPTPKLHSILRLIARMREDAAGYVEQAKRSRPKTVPRVYKSSVSLVDVAADTGSKLEDLIAVNQGVDPFDVPAGTTIYTMPRYL